MNTRFLESIGFGTWSPFKKTAERQLLASLPERPGVYIVRGTSLQLLAGDSDIRYIGVARNGRGLRGRIRQYLHPGPTQATNHFVLGHTNSGNYDLGFREVATGEEAVVLEKKLLRDFHGGHRQLPPWNKRF